MYRKIIFICFSIFQAQVIIKAMFLLSLSFISLFLIIIYKPFVIKELNQLEYKSDLSALITLYAGNLYLCNISETSQALCFFLIVLINTWFFTNFVYNLLYLFLQIHFDKFYKLFPKITTVITNAVVYLETTKIKCQFSSLKAYFSMIMNSDVKIYAMDTTVNSSFQNINYPINLISNSTKKKYIEKNSKNIIHSKLKTLDQTKKLIPNNDFMK